MSSPIPPILDALRSVALFVRLAASPPPTHGPRTPVTGWSVQSTSPITTPPREPPTFSSALSVSGVSGSPPAPTDASPSFADFAFGSAIANSGGESGE